MYHQSPIRFAALVIFITMLTLKPVNAQLFIDHGSYTTDLSSGYDWLDVTTTAYKSIDYVMTQQAEGGIYEGWRYATRDEVSILVSNYGNGELRLDYGNGSRAYNNGALAGLHLLLGSTTETGNKEFGLESSPGDTTYTVGFTADLDGIYSHPRYWLSYIKTSPDGSSAVDEFRRNYTSMRSEVAAPTIGSFLIRASEVSAVPIPAAAWFMGPALLGVLGLSRKNNRLTQSSA